MLGGRASRLFTVVALAVAGLALAAGSAGVSAPARAPTGSTAAALRRVVGPITPTTPSARSTATWHGGRTVAANGEIVNAYVSDLYPAEPNTPERWATFFATLVHGTELSSVSVYVATPAEITQMCGPKAVGCFGLGRIVIPGESIDGVTPEGIARHEYGHHIGLSRSNPPWTALDWGTKRWATHLGICARAEAGTLYPGNEDWGYRLNPGEGLAESYRALNESKLGATSFEWTLVDGSFYPDATALRLLEQDVVTPWTAPAQTTLRVRFSPKGKGVWSQRLRVPLDGTVLVGVTVPGGTLYEVTLRSADGKRQLARALVQKDQPGKLTTTACGDRVMLLQVVRKSAPGLVTLRVSTP